MEDASPVSVMQQESTLSPLVFLIEVAFERALMIREM